MDPLKFPNSRFHLKIACSWRPYNIYSWKPYHACKSLCVCGGKYIRRGHNIKRKHFKAKSIHNISEAFIVLYIHHPSSHSITNKTYPQSLNHNPPKIYFPFFNRTNYKTCKNPNKWALQGAIAYRLSMSQLLQLTDRWAHERTQ